MTRERGSIEMREAYGVELLIVFLTGVGAYVVFWSQTTASGQKMAQMVRSLGQTLRQTLGL
jgi:hypothetical protein